MKSAFCFIFSYHILVKFFHSKFVTWKLNRKMQCRISLPYIYIYCVYDRVFRILMSRKLSCMNYFNYFIVLYISIRAVFTIFQPKCLKWLRWRLTEFRYSIRQNIITFPNRVIFNSVNSCTSKLTKKYFAG